MAHIGIYRDNREENGSCYLGFWVFELRVTLGGPPPSNGHYNGDKDFIKVRLYSFDTTITRLAGSS